MRTAKTGPDLRLIVSQRVEDFCFELDEDNIDSVEFIENTAKKRPVSTFCKAPKLVAKEFLQLLMTSAPLQTRIGGGGGWVLGLIFAEYVPLTSQSPYLIIVHSIANYRPHLRSLLGKYVKFRYSNIITFYFYEMIHFLN